MGRKTESLEKRVKENIRNYTLDKLLGERKLDDYLGSLAEILQADIKLTDRAGDEVLNSLEETPDRPDRKTGNAVSENEGNKWILNVQGRTMAWLSIMKRDGAALSQIEESFVASTIKLLEQLATQTFLYNETAAYIDEKENSGDTQNALHQLEKADGLTGVFNKYYYEERMRVVDRSGMLPVALLFVNINDWKFVNDNFGNDESDRLIQVIANILKQEAKDEYVIGRVDGDVFQVLIPVAEEGEAENYKGRVQYACRAFEDEILAPSAAIGIQYKTNVEESLIEMVSDAEYEMFENKFVLKNEPGYAERLRKGLDVSR